MVMKNIFKVVVLLMLLGCEQNTGTIEAEGLSPKDTTAFAQQLQISNEVVILVPEAREITNEWLAYITTQTEIENFDQYTVEDIISNASPIAEIMQNLRQTVPVEFQTNAVETRLSVLYTKAKVLEFLSGKRNLDAEAISATAEEIPVEFNNFKIQLNELFLKSLEDFEKELDAFEIEDDTSAVLTPLPPGSREN